VQDARVAQPGLPDSPTGCRHSPRNPFDTEKIPIWIPRGDLDQKRSITASQVDFERGRSGKNRLDIQRRKIVRGNNFGI